MVKVWYDEREFDGETRTIILHVDELNDAEAMW